LFVAFGLDPTHGLIIKELRFAGTALEVGKLLNK